MSHGMENEAASREYPTPQSPATQDEFQPIPYTGESVPTPDLPKAQAESEAEGAIELPFYHQSSRFEARTNYGQISNEQPSEISREPLGNIIRTHMVQSVVEPKSKFLPAAKLHEIITTETITKELDRSKLRETDRKFIDIAQEVLGIQNATSDSDPKSRLKIFAVLALMQKAAKIVQFIGEGVYDCHLPLKFRQDARGGFSCSSTDEKPIAIVFFRRAVRCDTFDQYQWQLQAPFFELSLEGDQSVRNYNFDRRSILPFTEDRLEADDISESLAQEGGQAVVRRIVIHPAHHNYPSKSKNGGIAYFAVKQIRLSEEAIKARGKEPQQEAFAFRRSDNHDHLIRLLASYTHNDHFHMIFPWANGNLKEFWSKDYPDPSTLRGDGDLARWMAKQCLGLAQGLQSIHSPSAIETDAGEPILREYGRHGDLKPENILWFKEDTATHVHDRMGILKISDFGFADFHGPFSRSNVGVSSVGCTETYKAPEYDVKKQVSPKYDMWSLGCVFLQFSMWYIHGWDEVDKFSARRTADSKLIIPEDRFFRLHDARQVSGGRKIMRADLKYSVIEAFKALRAHDACSDFIWDMLEVIQSNLLRMNPKNRSGCDIIVQRLQKVLSNCLQSPQYCTTRQEKRVLESVSELSELASFDFSTEMERYTIESMTSGPSSIMFDRSQGLPDGNSLQDSPPRQQRESSGETRQPTIGPSNSTGDEDTDITPRPTHDSSTRAPQAGAPQSQPTLKRGLRWLAALFKRCFSFRGR